MTFEIFFLYLDYFGVFVFAVSGGLAAAKHRLDLFGVFLIAFITATGGGSLRDLILDRPVFWLLAHEYLIIAGLGALTTFIFPRLWPRVRGLVWFDALGLSVFSVLGAAIAYDAGYGLLIVLIMGTMTASAGGLLRDVICNEHPMLLRKDIYATAALLGAFAYWGARESGLEDILAISLGAVIAFGLRALAIRFRLELPKPMHPGE